MSRRVVPGSWAWLLPLLVAQVVVAQDRPREPGRVQDVSCPDEPACSYALYLPTGYAPERSWPLLIVLDARGRGREATERFREAGERLGYVVVGSNDVRSDGPYDPNLQATRALLGDLQSRLPLDERRIYLAGFSGMARFACDLGFFMEGHVAGVIAAGAGFSEQLPPKRDTPFDFYATIGDTDFNYHELRRLEERLPDLGLTHHITFFEGGHHWPSAELAGQALEWMHLQAMKDERLPRSASFIEARWRSALGEARALEERGALLDARRAYRYLVTDFTGLRDVAEAVEERDRLDASAEVKKHSRSRNEEERQDRITIERMRSRLGRLGTRPERRPTLKRLVADLHLDELRTQQGSGETEEQRRRAARILENVYVQASFYVPTRLIEQRSYRDAALSLSLAAYVKPDEPVVHYNLACAESLAGEVASALESLGRAVELGFDDAGTMESDPDLEPLRDEPGFGELLGRVSKGR